MNRLKNWLVPSVRTDYDSVVRESTSTTSRPAVDTNGNYYSRSGIVEITSSSSPHSYQNRDDHDDEGEMNKCHDTSGNVLDIDDAVEYLGMGKFQTQILFASGLCFAADAMEVLLLSFLAVILKVEWGLSERQTDAIVSVVFAGAMTGTLILGPLGDKIGRQPVFSITAAMIAICGLGTAAVPNYEWFLIVRFLVGFGVGGLTVPFDTLAEFIPTSHRGRNLLFIEFFWTAGTLLVPVCAWWTLGGGDDGDGRSSWTLFVVMCSIPCLLATLLALIYVPESPRWLLTQGKHDKALQILRDAARINGKDPYETFPEGVLLVESNSMHEDQGSILDLFSPKWLRITLLLWVAWFGFSFLYYGAILEISLVFSSITRDDEAVDKSSYDFDYSAIFISASSEIVGLILVLLTVDRVGRIPTQSATALIGGIACMLLGILAFYSDSSLSSRNTLICLAFLARMMMMGSSSMIWVSTSEILTTEIRTTGHSAANSVGRIAGCFVPFAISEGNSMRVIGIVLFVVSFFTCIATSQLPETKGKAMGDIHEIKSEVETVAVHGTQESCDQVIPKESSYRIV